MATFAVPIRSGSGREVSDIPTTENIRGLRVNINLLGDGYVEVIPDEILRAIAVRQPRTTNGTIHGEPFEAPILESTAKAKRIGRFGWKAQHATLVSASADALHGELGVLNYLYSEPLVPNSGKQKDVEKSQSNQQPASTAQADTELQDLIRFIRSSEPLAQDADLAKKPDVIAGRQLFEKIGCGICHVNTFTTSPAGTVINGGTYVVPEQLGGKATTVPHTTHP